MKILLAGATGVIGRELLPLLVKDGYEVIGTTRQPARTAEIAAAGATPLVLDALERDKVFAALAQVRPDVVLHQLTDLSTRNWAGNSHLREAGTRNLVDAALSVGVQRMIAQSIAWVTIARDTPAQETDPLDLEADEPRRSTIRAVQALEEAVAEMPIGIVLRYGFLYGAGTWYARDGWIAEQVQAGKLTATAGIQSFVHVVDAAEAARLALHWSAGIVNIADDAPAAGTEWLPIYAKLVGAPPPPQQDHKEGWERGVSNAKAKQLGWLPRYPDWHTGFQAVLG